MSEISEPELEDLTIQIESLTKNQGHPASTSQILELLLEKNNGNLGLSMSQIADFFKYVSRNRSTNGVIYPNENAKWMKNNILDEFSYDFPFNQLRDDETEYKGLFGIQRANFDTSLRNRTGEPYHVASMGALMSEFPPEIIALLTTGEYVKFGPEHGIQKALVDISTIGDLYNLSRVLEKYNSGDNINNCK